MKVSKASKCVIFSNRFLENSASGCKAVWSMVQYPLWYESLHGVHSRVKEELDIVLKSAKSQVATGSRGTSDKELFDTGELYYVYRRILYFDDFNQRSVPFPHVSVGR